MALNGHDASDKASQDQPPVTIGLFGLGRAGSIHLSNILANRKVELKYIVEDDESKWESVIKSLNLKGITFLKSSEAETLYNDKGPSINYVGMILPIFDLPP